MHRAERIPPNVLEAEMALLGAVLCDPKLITPVAATVRETDFYAHVHGEIFRGILQLFNAGACIDRVSLAEHFRAHKRLDEIGGPSYLSSLMETVQTTQSAMYYARIIANAALYRRVIEISSHAADRAYAENAESPEALVADITDALTAEARRVELAKAALPEQFWEINRRLTGSEPQGHGLTYGFWRVDEVTNGAQPQQVSVLGARIGVGKSSIGEHVAVRNCTDVPVLYFALEMGGSYTHDRIAARLSGRTVTAYQRLGRPALSLDTKRHFDLRIVDDSEVSDSASIEAIVRKARPKLVIIDHCRHIKGWFEGGKRRADIGPTEILYRLRDMARRENLHLILMSQLNREADGQRPRLKDLRDAGAFEEIAHRVLLLHRPFAGTTRDGIAELLMLKDRSGPTFITHAGWAGETMSYHELSDEENQQAACCAAHDVPRRIA